MTLPCFVWLLLEAKALSYSDCSLKVFLHHMLPCSDCSDEVFAPRATLLWLFIGSSTCCLVLTVEIKFFHHVIYLALTVQMKFLHHVLPCFDVKLKFLNHVLPCPDCSFKAFWTKCYLALTVDIFKRYFLAQTDQFKTVLPSYVWWNESKILPCLDSC